MTHKLLIHNSQIIKYLKIFYYFLKYVQIIYNTINVKLI